MKNHNSAGYYSLTGVAPPTDDQRLRDSLDLFPAYGCIVDKLAPAPKGVADVRRLPARHRRRLDHARPARQLPRQGAQPAVRQPGPEQPDFRLPELTLPDSLTPERLENRKDMLKLIDEQSRPAGRRRPSPRGSTRRTRRPWRCSRRRGSSRRSTCRRRPKKTRDALRPHHLRPGVPAGPAAGRGRGEVRQRLLRRARSAATGRAGTPRLQRQADVPDPRTTCCRSPTRRCRRCSTTWTSAGCSTTRWWSGWASSAARRGSTPTAAATTGRSATRALLAGGGVKSGLRLRGERQDRRLPDASARRGRKTWRRRCSTRSGIDPETEIRDTLNRPLPIARGKPINDVIA